MYGVAHRLLVIPRVEVVHKMDDKLTQLLLKHDSALLGLPPSHVERAKQLRSAFTLPLTVIHSC